VVGPMAGRGLTLAYLDAAGAPTTDAALVRAVRATLAATTERAVASGWTGGPARVVTDSLTTELTLRNTVR
jgi:hypothetical protein